MLCHPCLYSLGLHQYLSTAHLPGTLKAVNSSITSAIVFSSSRPFINCSFSLLLNIFVLTVCGLNTQPAHPFLGRLMTFSLMFAVLQGQYVSLWCGLNFSLNVENSPSAVLHPSFSKLVKVYSNCKPSLPNQFFI